jgi:4-hydroxy-4-methyl-2-oxoglutarate aldolase
MFTGISVCDISDACDALRIPAARSGGIRPVHGNCPAVAGTVSTVSLVPGATPSGASPLPALLDALERATGDIVLIDLAGRTDAQCWGTVLATAAVACGIGAAVVNGAARDTAGLAQMGFPTFARGVYPAAMRGRLEFAGADLPVIIDGATVLPGHSMAADEDGVVFFPGEHAEEVYARARELAETERTLLARARGASALAVLRGKA